MSTMPLNKRKPPPPPPRKPKHLSGGSTASNTTNVQSSNITAPLTKRKPSEKKGLGWPWDQPASHFHLYTNPSFSSSSPSSSATTTASAPVSWFFNWELWVPSPPPSSTSVPWQWTPCIRTPAQIPDLDPFLTDIIFNRKIKVNELLGFNEPEIPSQANIPVPNAVEMWKTHVIPAKQKFGLRLGSPGMSCDRRICIPWLDEFFTSLFSSPDGGGQRTQERGDQVDFLVLHWYGSSVSDFKNFVTEMHERYFGLPVWVNEFAFSRTSDSENDRMGEEEIKNCIKEAVVWLEETEWVERYAYYGIGQGGDVGTWVGRGSNFTVKAHPNEASKYRETDGRKLSEVGQLYLSL